MRVFNFAAGPATLPLEVLEQARDELTDWQGCGMSVMEVSHRSKRLRRRGARGRVAAARAAARCRRTTRCCSCRAAPPASSPPSRLNLAGAEARVDYLNTGAWSKKAIAEARRFLAHVNVAADESASNYTTVPAAARAAP